MDNGNLSADLSYHDLAKEFVKQANECVDYDCGVYEFAKYLDEKFLQQYVAYTINKEFIMSIAEKVAQKILNDGTIGHLKDGETIPILLDP